MPLPPEPDWLPPDTAGISTAWLTDPTHSTLSGKRLRCAFERAAPALDTWPAAWRELLALWVRRATPDKRYRHDALLARAGAGRANIALTLFDRLLVDGLAEVEERCAPKRGWHAHSLRVRDPAALRRALALPEPDAARSAGDERRSTTFAHPELETARAALDPLPPATALARMDLLAALERWSDEGRDSGLATRRDFAWFARADTKKITDTELHTMLRTAETPERSVPEQSGRTLIELPTLERQGRHGEIIEQRKHLRAQHAELFDYYMQNRA